MEKKAWKMKIFMTLNEGEKVQIPLLFPWLQVWIFKVT